MEDLPFWARMRQYFFEPFYSQHHLPQKWNLHLLQQIFNQRDLWALVQVHQTSCWVFEGVLQVRINELGYFYAYDLLDSIRSRERRLSACKWNVGLRLATNSWRNHRKYGRKQAIPEHWLLHRQKIHNRNDSQRNRLARWFWESRAAYQALRSVKENPNQLGSEAVPEEWLTHFNESNILHTFDNIYTKMLSKMINVSLARAFCTVNTQVARSTLGSNLAERSKTSETELANTSGNNLQDLASAISSERKHLAYYANE